MRLAQFRYNVESCIRTLSDMARNRSIAIPSDLDKNQVSSLFNKPAQIMLGKASKIFRSSRLQSAQLNRESSQSQVWLFLVFHPVNRLTVFFLHSSWVSGSIGASSTGLQDILVLLEAQLHPLVQSESSVIVDVLYRPKYSSRARTPVKSATMAVSSAGWWWR